MKICPKCNCENDDNTIYCYKCGTPLETQSGVICPACGVTNQSKARFCINCGKELSARETQIVHTTQQTTKEVYSNCSAVTIVLGIFGIILGIVSFFFVYTSFVGLGCSIVCTVLAAKAPRYNKRDVPGLVLGIIGIVMNAIMVIFAIFAIIILILALGSVRAI